VDEPFYACFLHETGLDHPMKDEVLSSQPIDWKTVASRLSKEEIPEAIYYQKHMTHHMLKGADLEWATHLTHCFLVRDPFEVVNSYRQKRDSINAEDIGINRQLELYREISAITGQKIPVLDARLVLMDPAVTLSNLCHHFGIPFYDEMLAWPAGTRDSDGVWSKHWYQAVEQSTGFEPWQPREITLTPDEESVARESLDAYNELVRLGSQ
jgi:hypothetical protein